MNSPQNAQELQTVSVHEDGVRDEQQYVALMKKNKSRFGTPSEGANLTIHQHKLDQVIKKTSLDDPRLPQYITLRERWKRVMRMMESSLIGDRKEDGEVFVSSTHARELSYSDALSGKSLGLRGGVGVVAGAHGYGW